MTQNEKIEKYYKLIKSKSKINQKDAELAVEFLKDMYVENKDIVTQSEIVSNSPHIIAKGYINKVYSKFTDDERVSFWLDLKKNLLNKAITMRTYPTYLSLMSCILNSNIDNSYLYTLVLLINKAEVDGKLQETKHRAFVDHYINKSKNKIFKVDYSALSEIELRTFKRCFDYLDIKNSECKKEYFKWLEKYNFENKEIKDVNSIKIESEKVINKKENKEVEICNKTNQKDEKIVNDIKSVDVQEELLQTINLANNEIKKMYQSVFEKNNNFVKLEERISQKDYEIKKLQLELEKEREKIKENQVNVDYIKKQLNESEDKNKDLENRLKLSYNADEINKNQELETLKRGIESAIRLEYDDYIENKDVEFNEENYIAFKNSLNLIFKALKRFGIDL